MNTTTLTMPNAKMSSLAPFYDAMMRHGIGLDQHFFERVADVPNFPPHNIEQLDEDRYRLTLAVAGFAEPQLDITIHNDILTVSGTGPPDDPSPVGRLLYSGIAFRDFSRQFKVGDHVFVDGATLKDGLLQIELMRRIPETLKPKKIVIGATTTKDQKPRLAA
jgi:molecular chaperone IbpA